MDDDTFCAPDDDVLAQLDDWFRGYIEVPHEELGRAGAICPFVAPSRRAGALKTLVHTWHGPATPVRMLNLIGAMENRFRSTSVPIRNTTMHSLVLVIKGLPRQDWWLIDEGHRLAKNALVERGLMLGQFHPLCAAPAARNPDFPVNRSPFPMFALRNMALHDVLFLHDNPRWFAHYQKRFGARYRAASGIDPQFKRLFDRSDR